MPKHSPLLHRRSEDVKILEAIQKFPIYMLCSHCGTVDEMPVVEFELLKS